MKVDLPEPDGPITATNSPSSTSSVTPSRAPTRPASRLYTRDRSRASMRAIGSEHPRPARPGLGLRRGAGGAGAAAGDHRRAFGQVARNHLGEAAVRDPEAERNLLGLAVGPEHEHAAGLAGLRGAGAVVPRAFAPPP